MSTDPVGLRQTRPKPSSEVSHNLLGQRLGRKGHGTRERILAAMARLLEGPPETAISLSAVAREASVGMTTLYLYFPDLGELLLATLQPLMEAADAAFKDRLCEPWPDDQLAECCLDFLLAHYEFWRRHSRILHLRNSFADANDPRLLRQRNGDSAPIIELLVFQMSDGGADPKGFHTDLATVLLTGIERLATVVTNWNFPDISHQPDEAERAAHISRLIRAQAWLLERAIREQRQEARR